MIKRNLSSSVTSNRKESVEWRHFRGVCEQVAVVRYGEEGEEPRPAQYQELRQEPFANLVAELQVQQEVQRRLALEYATALDGCRKLQEKIAGQSIRENSLPSADLDQRLEREVLELAICEEAYELVCEEMEQVRRELARRGATSI
jgi:hypothetical protein